MAVEYTAFISYRHAPLDVAAAGEIQKRLERYRIPKEIRAKTGKDRIGRIFRDKEELTITSDLGDEITEALEHSEFLIVICSRATKESAWVTREIETFLKTHSERRIFTVIVEGEPQEVIPEAILVAREGELPGGAADSAEAPSSASASAATAAEAESEGITDGTTAEAEAGTDSTSEPEIRQPIPPVHEPLSCDFRSSSRRERQSEISRLAAAILGVRYDELVMRERQYRRRRAAVIGGSASALAAVAIAYLVWSRAKIQENYELAQYNYELSQENYQKAEENYQLAETNYEESQKNLREALYNQSRYLDTEAKSLLETGDDLRAISLLTEALPADGDERPLIPMVQSDLVRALHAYRAPQTADVNHAMTEVFKYRTEGDIEKYYTTDDSRYLLVLDSRGIFYAFDLESNACVFELQSAGPEVSEEDKIADLIPEIENEEARDTIRGAYVALIDELNEVLEISDQLNMTGGDPGEMTRTQTNSILDFRVLSDTSAALQTAGGVYAYDFESGEVLWEYAYHEESYADEDVLLRLSRDKSTICLIWHEYSVKMEPFSSNLHCLTISAKDGSVLGMSEVYAGPSGIMPEDEREARESAGEAASAVQQDGGDQSGAEEDAAAAQSAPAEESSDQSGAEEDAAATQSAPAEESSDQSGAEEAAAAAQPAPAEESGDDGNASDGYHKVYDAAVSEDGTLCAFMTGSETDGYYAHLLIADTAGSVITEIPVGEAFVRIQSMRFEGNSRLYLEGYPDYAVLHRGGNVSAIGSLTQIQDFPVNVMCIDTERSGIVWEQTFRSSQVNKLPDGQGLFTVESQNEDGRADTFLVSLYANKAAAYLKESGEKYDEVEFSGAVTAAFSNEAGSVICALDNGNMGVYRFREKGNADEMPYFSCAVTTLDIVNPGIRGNEYLIQAGESEIRRFGTVYDEGFTAYDGSTLPTGSTYKKCVIVGDYMAALDNSGGLHVFSLTKEEETGNYSTGYPDGGEFLGADEERRSVWLFGKLADGTKAAAEVLLADGTVKIVRPEEGNARGCRRLEDGRLMFMCYDEIVLTDPADDSAQEKQAPVPVRDSGAVFYASPSGKTVIMRTFQRSKRAYAVNMESGEQTVLPAPMLSSLKRVSWNEDETRMAASDGVRVYVLPGDGSSGEEEETALTIAEDGQKVILCEFLEGDLAVLYGNGLFARYDAETGKMLAHTELSMYQESGETALEEAVWKVGYGKLFLWRTSLMKSARILYIVDLDSWEQEAAIPDAEAYDAAGDRIIALGKNSAAKEYNLGWYPRYTPEDLRNKAEEALEGFTLTEEERGSYGLS